MADSNNDGLLGERRSIIQEHGVITFVAQIVGGKSKPRTDILDARRWFRPKLFILLFSIR